MEAKQPKPKRADTAVKLSKAPWLFGKWHFTFKTTCSFDNCVARLNRAVIEENPKWRGHYKITIHGIDPNTTALRFTVSKSWKYQGYFVGNILPQPNGSAVVEGYSGMDGWILITLGILPMMFIGLK